MIHPIPHPYKILSHLFLVPVMYPCIIVRRWAGQLVHHVKDTKTCKVVEEGLLTLLHQVLDNEEGRVVAVLVLL